MGPKMQRRPKPSTQQQQLTVMQQLREARNWSLAAASKATHAWTSTAAKIGKIVSRLRQRTAGKILLRDRLCVKKWAKWVKCVCFFRDVDAVMFTNQSQIIAT